MVLWLPGFAVAGCSDDESFVGVCAAFMAGVGGTAWIVTASYFISPVVGCISIGFIYLFAVFMILKGCVQYKQILSPLILTTVISILYFSVVGDHGQILTSGDVNSFVAHRYWVSVDNKIPQLFSEKIFRGEGIAGYLVGDWLLSDRPPLSSGLIMPAFFSPPFLQNIEILILGMLGNGLWIIGSWSFFYAIGMRKEIPYVVIMIALCGPIFVNTVYVWPKLMAAGFAFCGLATIITNSSRWLMAGFLISLAVLSHTGVVIGVLAFAVALILVNKQVSIKCMLLTCLSAMILALPWFVYSKQVSPPANRLAKWHLAGAVELDDNTLKSSLVKAYDKDYIVLLENKINNIKTTIGMFEGQPGSMYGWESTWDGRLRITLLSSLFFIPCLGLIALLNFKYIKSGPTGLLALCSLITYLLYVFIEYGGRPYSLAWLHTAPYTLLVIWPGFLFLLSIKNILMAYLIIFLQILFFVTVWIYGPTNAAAHDLTLLNWQPVMVLTEILCLVLLLIVAARSVHNVNSTVPSVE